MRQVHWLQLGVAAVAVATVGVVAIVQTVGAGATGPASSLVPITPCRLMDTRAGSDNVGSRSKPIGAGEAATFQVSGTNGNCSVPSNATAIATNATAVNPTSGSYVTIYPADANPRPTASNLNFVAGAAPTPNQVTVGLSATGAIGIYNLAGTVDLIVDIVGYYTPADAGGTPGPAGYACPAAGCTVFVAGSHANGVFNFPVSVDTAGCIFGGTFLLPLDLPIGANITNVAVQYRDTNATPFHFFTFTLERHDAVGTRTIVANQPTTTTGETSVDFALNGSVVPAGANARYQLGALTANSSSALTLCGVTVTYNF